MKTTRQTSELFSSSARGLVCNAITTPPTRRSPAIRMILFSLLGAIIPGSCFGLAISPGSDSTAGLGNTANAIVQIADPGGDGSGTIIQMMPFDGGVDLDVLTADHVIRNASGGGSTIYTPGQISITFGNAGAGGASFAAEDEATLFDLPSDGSSAVDLAIVDVFIPGSQLNTLPAGLAAVALPNARPAANAAITQAGYGLQASVVNIGGTLSYSYSPVFNDGAGYGTLKAGPNSLNGAGVTAITGAVSDYAGQNYAYQGFQNSCVINGTSPTTTAAPLTSSPAIPAAQASPAIPFWAYIPARKRLNSPATRTVKSLSPATSGRMSAFTIICLGSTRNSRRSPFLNLPSVLWLRSGEWLW